MIDKILGWLGLMRIARHRQLLAEPSNILSDVWVDQDGQLHATYLESA